MLGLAVLLKSSYLFVYHYRLGEHFRPVPIKPGAGSP